MLKRNKQIEISLSPYRSIYEILIEKENMWREINERIDFGFVYEELKERYSSTKGRTCEDIIRMFKYLLLKSYYKVSDRGLIERTKTDMLFKYFLGYEPEETEFIDASSLTRFRRERIKTEDTSENIMEKLIQTTVEYAIEEGLIEVKNKIIVDSMHTVSRYGKLSPREELIKQAKKLRKAIYTYDEKYKARMPKKKESTGILEDQIEYTEELLQVVKEIEIVKKIPELKEKMYMLEETKEDIKEALKSEKKLQEYTKDKEAKTGHKTADTAFFGYKVHIAMTPERIVTGCTLTSGEKTDGKELPGLIEQTESTGLEIEAVIGDGAYSDSDNLKYCKDKGIKVASKLNKMIIEGHQGKNIKEYEYNKDADMYVCKAGHMAIRKAKDKTGSKNRDVMRYYFDVEKCKLCPLKEGCYKQGAKKKSLTVTLKKPEHIEQMEYMETEEFKELYKERYKIEAKNGEAKNIGDLKTAYGCGKVSMTIQGASTLFLLNIKRIRKLREEKEKKKQENS